MVFLAPLAEGAVARLAAGAAARGGARKLLARVCMSRQRGSKPITDGVPTKETPDNDDRYAPPGLLGETTRTVRDVVRKTGKVVAIAAVGAAVGGLVAGPGGAVAGAVLGGAAGYGGVSTAVAAGAGFIAGEVLSNQHERDVVPAPGSVPPQPLQGAPGVHAAGSGSETMNVGQTAPTSQPTSSGTSENPSNWQTWHPERLAPTDVQVPSSTASAQIAAARMDPNGPSSPAANLTQTAAATGASPAPAAMAA